MHKRTTTKIALYGLSPHPSTLVSCLFQPSTHLMDLGLGCLIAAAMAIGYKMGLVSKVCLIPTFELEANSMRTGFVGLDPVSSVSSPSLADDFLGFLASWFSLRGLGLGSPYMQGPPLLQDGSAAWRSSRQRQRECRARGARTEIPCVFR